MEYTYMQNLKEWDSNKNWNDTGVEEGKISEIQQKYNILFPLSYKEYLSISGVQCPAIVQGHGFEYLEDQQQLAQDLLDEHGLRGLIEKPFWVIATSDRVAFWYFHQDEGDNPPIYRLDCESYGDVPKEMAFGKVADSFQAWIEKAITNYERSPLRQ